MCKGLKYAGTKNGDAQELLYDYAVYFLNEVCHILDKGVLSLWISKITPIPFILQIKHITASSNNDLPKGLSEFVDRGTLEICVHLIVLSLSLVRIHPF